MSENKSFMFTSESVTEGHPDKVADAISDAILDAIMAQDKKCRVACETLVTTGLAMVAGEITTDCYVDIPEVVRNTIKDIGYNSSNMGFDWQTCSVVTSIDQQSADIAQGVDGDTKFFVNPTGRFVVGGPMGDCGVTGRKIIVDTYGGQGSHGGGCFSGKDPSKVDRSASYMGRYIAKNIVASGIADKCEVQVAYAIGVAEPVSLLVDFMGTGKISVTKAVEIVKEVFDLRPAAIIETLDLLRPIYRKTSAYGHFGRKDPDFYWERTDKADQIKDLAGI